MMKKIVVVSEMLHAVGVMVGWLVLATAIAVAGVFLVNSPYILLIF